MAGGQNYPNCACRNGTEPCVEVVFQKERQKPTLLLKASNVIVATGSRAVQLPSLEGWYDVDVGGHVRVHDSDSIKHLTFLPRSYPICGKNLECISVLPRLMACRSQFLP